MRRQTLIAALFIAVAGCRGPASPLPALDPRHATEAVPADPDDPAVWVHPTDPARSLILATDKVEADGGLHIFGLDGRRHQVLGPLDRPNNVDVEQGVPTPDGPIDIAVVTERRQRRLRVFRIPTDGGHVTDLAPNGIPVLDGQPGPAGEPMGVGIYKRPGDGAVFAIVAPKAGGASEYLWQYRLSITAGGVTAVPVRRFGHFSGTGSTPDEAGEIEAVVVDDELGYVYYADERFGIRKWHANPDHHDAWRELALFGTDGYEGDREGLAVYRRPGGSGYVVSSDQIAGGSRLMVYPREGRPGAPHAHPLIAVIPTPADETDGLDVVAAELPGYPQGLLVMMNSAARNFLLFPWSDVQARIDAGGVAR